MLRSAYFGCALAAWKRHTTADPLARARLKECFGRLIPAHVVRRLVVSFRLVPLPLLTFSAGN